MNALRVDVPAKINLHLEVIGRRPDGFHEVRTLLQSIDLRDRVAARSAPEGQLELVVDPDDAVPADDDNLVLQAARALWDLGCGRPGARIRLTKRIPVGAGLGGGSADAAATIVLLDRLWRLGLERWQMAQVAASLGSDVPFFLVGGLGLGVGRGDELVPLSDLEPPRGVVLAIPPVEVSTREVYRRLETRLTWTRPEATLGSIAAGWEREPRWPRLRNDLEPVVCTGWPEVAAARAAIDTVDGLRSGVTGSGSAVFTLVEGVDEAARVAVRVDSPAWRVVATRTLTRAEAAPTPVACEEEDVR